MCCCQRNGSLFVQRMRNPDAVIYIEFVILGRATRNQRVIPLPCLGPNDALIHSFACFRPGDAWTVRDAYDPSPDIAYCHRIRVGAQQEHTGLKLPVLYIKALSQKSSWYQQVPRCGLFYSQALCYRLPLRALALIPVAGYPVTRPPQSNWTQRSSPAWQSSSVPTPASSSNISVFHSRRLRTLNCSFSVTNLTSTLTFYRSLQHRELALPLACHCTTLHHELQRHHIRPVLPADPVRRSQLHSLQRYHCPIRGLPEHQHHPPGWIREREAAGAHCKSFWIIIMILTNTLISTSLEADLMPAAGPSEFIICFG